MHEGGRRTDGVGREEGSLKRCGREGKGVSWVSKGIIQIDKEAM